MYSPCAVIPVYNHGHAIASVVAALRKQGLPSILVDDGSEPRCAAILDLLRGEGVILHRRARNGGKGAAVRDGLMHAAAAGHTHALQIDADGQHALEDVARLLAASRAEPDAMIGGAPVYGDDAPKARVYGRWLTRVWVWINTLSFDIPDAMCGFRVYPLRQTLPILPGIAQRMDFDIDIVVRLHWAGVAMRWLPTPVRYPSDGVSHFRMVADNARISRVHARLFAGMLWRAPLLLCRRLKDGTR